MFKRSITYFALIIIGIVISSYNTKGQHTSNTIVYSENQAYFIKIKPYAFSTDSLGISEVFKNSDSSLLYSFNYILNPKYLLISNDGLSIFEIGKKDHINFYNSGKKTNELNLNNLIDYKNEFCCANFLYELFPFKERSNDQTNFKIEFIANKNPFFSHNDTVYLITCTDTILIIDIKNAAIIKSISIYDPSINIRSIQNERLIIEEKFESPSKSGFPNLIDGSSFKSKLAEYLEMVYEDAKYKDLKYYYLTLQCLISSKGICEEIYLDFEIRSKEDSIRQYIKSVRFDTTAFSQPVDKWLFSAYGIPFRNPDKAVARKELQIERIRLAEEYQERLIADSIRGIYIPKDLADCMIQLDTLLTPERKKVFLKNGRANEHFGLGLWIRNNWGLWGGSRLQRYFIDLGFNHPDHMSGFILDTYYKYLNNKTIDIQHELEKFLNK